ncbi:MAG TPA: hypothetical protein VN203_16795, partial [Candidatus Acidoferrum sp.]|nr:hypothetical protein [Candidatus Acidoferrum sp.]
MNRRSKVALLCLAAVFWGGSGMALRANAQALALWDREIDHPPPSIRVQNQPGRDTASAVLPAGTILRVSLEAPLKVSKLRAGNVVEGKLARSSYLGGTREAAPAGSKVRLIIESVRKESVSRSRVLTFFADIGSFYWCQRPTRRHYTVSFRSANLILADGSALPMTVSLIRIVEPVELRSPSGTAGKGKSATTHEESAAKRQEVVLLQLDAPLAFPAPLDSEDHAASAAATSRAGSVALQPGTKAHLLLLGDVTASRNRAGDTLQARLEEPIRMGEQIVLPEGS